MDTAIEEDYSSDVWIRKESRSRPNRYYYYNKITKESRCELSSVTKKILKAESESADKTAAATTSTTVNKSADNSSKSKTKTTPSKPIGVRKSRTPAQDRLNKVITKNAEIANTIRNDIKLPNNHKYSVQDRILKFRKKYEKRHRDKADTHRLSNEIYKSTSHLKHKETIVSNRENLSLLTTTPSVIDNVVAADSMDEEQMDWEPSFSTGTSSNELSSGPLFYITETDTAIQNCVVPDTNVFISAINCIKDIIAEDENSTVVIPYMVLQELDKLKMKRNDPISEHSQRAIKFIYATLKDGHKRFVGQSATDDRNHIIEITNPDDKILNCCIQLKEHRNQVALLSQDKNLCCKAKASGINIITPRMCNELFDKKD